MAVAAEVVVRKVREWQLPVQIGDREFEVMRQAIADGDEVQLARKLEVCDPNEAGPADNHSKELAVPLVLAVKARRPQLVRMLLRAGANPNVASGPGETALYQAIGASSPDIARLLIGAGADPNVAAWGARTPLMRASTWNRIEVAKLLLDAGADVNAKSQHGDTPLGNAKTPEMTALLRERGAK